MPLANIGKSEYESDCNVEFAMEFQDIETYSNADELLLILLASTDTKPQQDQKQDATTAINK